MSWDWLRLKHRSWWRCGVFPHYAGWTRFGPFFCLFSFAVNFGLLTSTLANGMEVATVNMRTSVRMPWVWPRQDSNSCPHWFPKPRLLLPCAKYGACHPLAPVTAQLPTDLATHNSPASLGRVWTLIRSSIGRGFSADRLHTSRCPSPPVAGLQSYATKTEKYCKGLRAD